MKFVQLTWFHFKRIVFHNLGLVLISFVMPVIMISGFLFIFSSEDNPNLGQSVVVVNHSEFVQEHIYPKLSPTYQEGFTNDMESSFEELDQAETAMVYEIPNNFPENGSKIKVHSINGENNDIFFESEFQAALSEAVLENGIQEAGINFTPVEVSSPTVNHRFTPIDGRLVMVLFMVTFFMSYTCGLIAGDLNSLRSDGVLTRSIVTNAYSWQILGSILSAYTLYNFIAAMAIIIICSLIFSIPLTSILLIISAVLAFCIFTAGLTMVLFRLLKNEQLIQIVGIILVIALVFIGMNIIGLDELSFIQYISPFYWLFEALDTGVVLSNIPIIALYGLVLFTAGSFKVERLVKR